MKKYATHCSKPVHPGILCPKDRWRGPVSITVSDMTAHFDFIQRSALSEDCRTGTVWEIRMKTGRPVGIRMRIALLKPLGDEEIELIDYPTAGGRIPKTPDRMTSASSILPSW